MTQVHFVVNPNSGGGRGGAILRRLPELVSRRLPASQIHTTQSHGDAVTLAKKAAAAGATLVVAVGGDGTLHEVCNGVLAAHSPDCAVALLPGGRGSDFARAMGISTDLQQALANLDAPSVRMDVGHVTAGGTEQYFVNVADAGLGGYVVDTVNRWRLPIGGGLTYSLATLWGLARYGGSRMKLTWEGDSSGELDGRFIEVAIANGSYFGGGMHIAPEAKPNDGLFDVVALRQVGRIKTTAMGPALYGGRIHKHPWAVYFRCRRIRIESPERVSTNLDGELAPCLPADFQILPGALPFKLPPNSTLFR